jgi:hypothetical protein
MHHCIFIQFRVNEIRVVQLTLRVGTNTAAALRFVKDTLFSSSAAYGNRLAVRDVVILISDGASNMDRDLTVPVAREAINMGIEVSSQRVHLTGLVVCGPNDVKIRKSLLVILSFAHTES